jgi:hypothetical protein
MCGLKPPGECTQISKRLRKVFCSFHGLNKSCYTIHTERGLREISKNSYAFARGEIKSVK